MIISELIDALNNALNKYGDIDVKVGIDYLDYDDTIYVEADAERVNAYHRRDGETTIEICGDAS